jgi:hypothetical protein
MSTKTRASEVDQGSLLFGAEEISIFLFSSAEHRRRVYHLAEKHGLPVFRIGSTLCARRERLRKWLEAKEEEDEGTELQTRGPCL